mgnify:CR=1 FL=1
MQKFSLAVLTFLILFVTSCQIDQKKSAHPEILRPVEVRHAKGLRIWKNESTYKIQVRNPQDTLEIIGTYFFKISGDSADIPINSFALGSTTIASYFQRLDLNDKITGLTFSNLVLNSELQARINSGVVAELTSGGELDFEKVLALNPDCFLTYSTGSSNLDRIQEQGIDVFALPEHLESTPLGRAEWIKMIGCLNGNLEESISAFEEIEGAYSDLKAQVALISTLPRVFTGSRYRDHWYAPGNESYIAAYIRDAGGNYTFRDIEGHGSAELDMEAALVQMSQSDYWGMVVSQDSAFTIDQLVEEDERYADFSSVKSGNIFVCNSKKADYFGDGVVEPHLILADLVSIFHPNVLPNHEYIYFRPVS